VDIGKAGMPVATTEDNHFIAHQIGRVVAFSMRHVATSLPLLPRQPTWIRHVERPNVIQRRLTIAPAKHDEKVAI
jgi:hypothetical protein